MQFRATKKSMLWVFRATHKPMLWYLERQNHVMVVRAGFFTWPWPLEPGQAAHLKTSYQIVALVVCSVGIVTFTTFVIYINMSFVLMWLLYFWI